MTEFSGEIHPYAAIFPMLPDEDLKALAEDIAANGQLHPILLTPDGVLVDGRNRLAACDLAGVPPKFETVERDPFAVILSANVKRRQMSAGQVAMATAIGLVEQGKRENGRWAKGATVEYSTDRTFVHRAGVVLDADPPLALQVLNGSPTLQVAYERVNEIRKQRETEDRQLATLRAEAPDLAGHVTDGAFPLAEMYAAYLERTREEREAAKHRADGIRKNNIGVTEAVFRLHLLALHDGNVPDWFATYDPHDAIHPITKELVHHARAALNMMESHL